MSFIKNLLGLGNEAEIKKINKIVDKVCALEESYKKLPDAQLRGKTAEFRERIAKGETLDALLPEAFAAVGEAAWRSIGQRPFRTQLITGVVLHQGRIAEMKTGEGKTLAAVMPVYLNALEGKGAHIVTVNDYLARFQGEWMGRIYDYLGMKTGVILHDLTTEERREAYASDVTYGTNNEFGFDYLRDNMVVRKENMVQRDLHYAIVDEVDSILIDEARTPLIISGQGDKSTDLYMRADRFARTMVRDADFEVDEKLRHITITERGIQKAERYFNVENFSDLENTALNHHVNQALKANVLFKKDVDYVVNNGEVVIVDEFTGRLMVGRRYSEGLHQAIEAKEGVQVERESKTLATITFQNFFRMYKKLSGMTGTAKTEEEEFQGIYHLDVVTIPTHRPMIRKDFNDVIYKTEAGKYAAVVNETVELHKIGRPVLVGTVSVEKSELISAMLKRRGVPHVVLNAKHHEKEAEIVAQAGKEGAVTIATNMAGRGTDILLGGNPEFLVRQDMVKQGYSEELIDGAQGHSADAPTEVVEARAVFAGLLKKYKAETDVAHKKVVELGGLFIIGTERHESRRIDNQLRGRSGRLGDPGSSRFYISLEDDLMRRFGGDRIAPLVEKLGMDEETPLENVLLSKQIESAQKRVEGHNYDIRKHVLQYDDVMNTQRGIIYKQRREVLEGMDMRSSILRMIEPTIEEIASEYCREGTVSEEWDIGGLIAGVERYFPVGNDVLGVDLRNLSEKDYLVLERKKLIEALIARGNEAYEERIRMAEEIGIQFSEIERIVLLRVVDERWMDHIDDMDHLRQGIGLRAVGHHNPVVEYKREGYDMFEGMIQAIQQDALRMLYNTRFNKMPEQRKEPEIVAASHDDGQPQKKKPRKIEQKVGRNDPCPCGSGKKYKQCCGRGA